MLEAAYLSHKLTLPSPNRRWLGDGRRERGYSPRGIILELALTLQIPASTSSAYIGIYYANSFSLNGFFYGI
jgi:hypothetical protein